MISFLKPHLFLSSTAPWCSGQACKALDLATQVRNIYQKINTESPGGAIRAYT